MDVGGEYTHNGKSHTELVKMSHLPKGQLNGVQANGVAAWKFGLAKNTDSLCAASSPKPLPIVEEQLRAFYNALFHQEA